MSDNDGEQKSGLSGFAQKLRDRVKSLRPASPSASGDGAAPGNPFLKKLSGSIRLLDPAAAAEWATGFFQRESNWGFYGKLLTIILCSYFIADLTAIMAAKMLPEVQAPRNRAFGFHRSRQLEDYNVITARNLFNSSGVIPGEEVGSPNELDLGGTPVRTSLPFDLIGTMIFNDEEHSIATIQDKSGNQVYPVRIQDEIPGKAKIVKIEARKVTFVNLQNHRREFVEMPETPEASHVSVASKGGGGGGGIEKVASNQFIVSHAEVERALSDLNNILTQARAVPNFENGQPAGYKLFQIVPGSIYQKLGIQEGDVIVGFDGQPANDPAAAFEKLSNLKNTSHLDLSIKRGGQLQTFSYDFR